MADAALHVLVPAYGSSPFLAETLASVPRQEDVLVTVVDDGSPTPVVQELAGTWDVPYVRLDPNRGVAGAFQTCVELSRGAYTVIVGSDDVFETGYADEVLRLVEAFGRPEMVQPGVTVIGAAGETSRTVADRVKRALRPAAEGVLSGDRLAASLLAGNWLYFPAMAWRTDALRSYGFRQDMTTVLDLDLVLRQLFDGARLAVSSRPVFRYRRHERSVSSRTARSGSRYTEESTVSAWAYRRARTIGWRRSAVAAALRPTARLHRLSSAASLLNSGDGRLIRPRGSVEG